MSTSDLSPAGSSSYSSSTLHVGDGTWSSDRDTFLLPPLEGVNFATMRYNGMGNRFRSLPQYHRLILGHAIIAAIVFLGIVPAAVFIAKFYRRNPRMAVKLHVYLQVLTVFLTTVVLLLGYFAVGPERSLTNPHHGIGVAIYVMVLVQFLYGWLMARAERRRKNPLALTRTPTKVWVHKLFGRTIGLLALAQIPLGLTLYGSPKLLFILYALAVAGLIILYLALDRYYFEKRPVYFGVDGHGGQPEFYSDYGSYLSGTRTDLTQDRRRMGGAAVVAGREEKKSHWGRNLLAAGGALGAYEAWKHRRGARRDDREQSEYDDDRRTELSRTEMTETTRRTQSRPPRNNATLSREEREQIEIDEERRAASRSGRLPAAAAMMTGGAGVAAIASSRPPSRGPSTPGGGLGRRPVESRLSPESWESDEKYAQRPRERQHTWRNRILGAGAGIAAFEGVKSIFARRSKRDSYIDEASYRRGGGIHNNVSRTDISRVEDGQAPFSPEGREERVNIAGVTPMTPSHTPGRAPLGRRPSADYSVSYDDDASVFDARYPPPKRNSQDVGEDGHTLRNSIATLGAIAGFREWNAERKRRRVERQQHLRMSEQEASELSYDRRHSMTYPRPQDGGAAGRRPSDGDTLLTGTDVHNGAADPGFGGSNPELNRVNFNGNAGRVDVSQPPLPATAGAVLLPPSGVPTFGPSVSQQRFEQQSAGYNLPPPPPGPPPAQGGYTLPGPPPGLPPQPVYPSTIPPGGLQMPSGAVNPDPGRLVSSTHDVTTTTQQLDSHGHPLRDAAAGALAGAAVANIASDRRERRSHSQSSSSSRYRRDSESRNRLQKPERRGSGTSASMSQSQSQSQSNVFSASNAGPVSPPVAVKVKMHNDGKHVTLRRLSETEAAAERATRRRRRRGSSLSSGVEDDVASGSRPPGSNSRYRRSERASMRPSSDQPITNVPVPPPMSNSALGRPHSDELNLPPAPRPQDGYGGSPASVGGLGSPPPVGVGGMQGSGVSGTGFGSPGDAGTGTDVSAFADNRRRRRAERARRLEAARGGGSRVEFQ